MLATKKKIKSKKTYKFGIKIDEMIQAGVHLGHHTSKLHPKMAENILGIRNTTHIINLEKTAYFLEKALEFIEECAKQKKKILFVGTKIPLRETVKRIAKECNCPFVTERWLGGTLTNFEVISKRVKYYQQLREKKEKGEFDHYTKKERLKIEKELENLREKFEGLEKLEELPDIVFICDIIKDKLALKEAKKKNIKVIAIVDTNADPTLVDFPIPANDDATTSVNYILEKVKQVIENTKVKSQNSKEK